MKVFLDYWTLQNKSVEADMKFWNLVFSYMKTIEIIGKIILLGQLAFTVPTMCQELCSLQRFCAVDHQESSGLTPVKNVSKQCGGGQDPECVRGVRPSYRRSNLWQVDLICVLREQKLQYKQWPLSQPGIATAMGNE